ncbi:hypothetical protein PISL3812_02849 [Talaromyces islandicus]|uniref:Uncharacterized protein n=1 Tax=Talaromyces islandicus TaxID=28573 RepID=A0A0U1LR10_TALIS|nr:hypothetical protein PISL3812_02849 [Talaromyces islandicus]
MATTTTTTEKIEDQEQPIHGIPVKEEENPSLPATKTLKRVSFDPIPVYINGHSSQTASPSILNKKDKENIAAVHELPGRKKKSSSPTIKGAGIVKNNTKSSHHHHRRRRHRLRQNDHENSNINNNDNNTANSYQPRLILRGPREPKYRLVKFKFEGRIIRTVNMEIPTC